MIPPTGGTQSSQIHRDEAEWWPPGTGARGVGVRSGKRVFGGYRASVWKDGKSSGSGRGDGCTL